MYIKGLRPPAASPLPLIQHCCLLVTAEHRLLASDCWLVTPCLLFVQDRQEAAEELRERIGRALGEPCERSEMASGGPRGGPGSHGRTSGGSREVQRSPRVF